MWQLKYIHMKEFLFQPWPWYIAGPVIGLIVPILLLIGNKRFGISSGLRQICAMCLPLNNQYLKYDWKKEIWNLYFIAGLLIGAIIASQFLYTSEQMDLSAKTQAELVTLGISGTEGFVPKEIFNWRSLLTLQGFIMIVVGGFLVGFGTRYANGCTSGHAIMGLSNLEWPSLVATIGFFIGGLISTHILIPLIF